MPVIGITTTSGIGADHEMREVPYLERIVAAGGTPVLVPTCLESRYADSIIAALDGIVLGGGPDIDPALYGNGGRDIDVRRHGNDEGRSIERDIFECALAHCAWELDLPILGICRGMQIMNVAFGGDLLHDLAEAGFDGGSHLQPKPYDRCGHVVALAPGTMLQDIFAEQTMEELHEESRMTELPSLIRTNSMHHQGIDRIAPGFVASACSMDSLVEGIENRSRRFFIGVQWHPEYLTSSQPLFDRLCRAAWERATEDGPASLRNR